jgi:phosphohistidine phosphatase SixA
MTKTAKTLRARVSFLTAGALACLAATAGAQAQQLSGQALVDALREGGYVIVQRHASASIPPARGGRGGFGGGRGGGARGGPDGGDREPQLDDNGIAMVTGMRYAFRTLKIPVGDVLTSPTQRAQQHARHFGFGNVHVVEELGTDAMQSDPARSEWLRKRAAQAPPAGTNTVIITHGPNITGAFGISEIAEGEALIIRPGNRATIVGRLPIEEWSKLAVN